MVMHAARPMKTGRISTDRKGSLGSSVLQTKHMYWEYESGVKDDRVELLKLLDVVQTGDTIATTEVSRLTRSTKRLC